MDNLEMYDVIIIGSGPAGLSCGLYTKRGGLKTLIFEKNAISGGQILNTHEVDNYLGIRKISGPELATKFREHTESTGVLFVQEMVEGIRDENDVKVVVTNKGEYTTKCVVCAMGTKYATLDVAGESEFKGKGVSYCAICDGAFYKDKTVVVVGGGNSALEDAIYLARICKKVYLIHRRDEFRGADILEKQLEECTNVELVMNSVVNSIEGDQCVKKVKIKKSTGEGIEIEAEGVFIAVGTKPDTELVADIVDIDEKGYIVADEDCITSRSGIFVAGDIRTKRIRQIVNAVSDGANAAENAILYCRNVLICNK